MNDADESIDLVEEESKIRVELENWLPRKGDKLFVSGPKAAFVDCTGFTGVGEERSPVGRRDLYASGYLLAADRLVDSWCGLAHEDALIYPVFFLYRHYLELELKGATSLFLNWLYEGTPEAKERMLGKLVENHRIRDLWSTLRSLAPAMVDKMEVEATAAFESLVQEIDDHDSNGQAARYAFYRDKKQTFLGLHEVHLDNLRTQFGKLSHYLGALEEAIHQEIDPEG